MAARKRSAVWTHFNEADASTAVCTICKVAISFRGGSTANLHRHLRTKHHVVLLTRAEAEEAADTLGRDAQTAGLGAKQTRNTAHRRVGSSSLPLSCLRLLVSPVRLVSAAIWQAVGQKAVLDYGSLEEFVFLVTEMVPELLSARQRAELILGLRARLILELCRSEDTANLQTVQPHLDRMQGLTSLWTREADPDEPSSESKFLDLVQNLLKDPKEKENFFQNVFPEEFGPAYDEALHTLMWLFLSRFEQFLPILSFQQIASRFEVSAVLEERLESMARSEELRTLLQYQKGKLNHKDGSLHSGCIISALKLPSGKKRTTAKTPPSVNASHGATPNTEQLLVDRITAAPEREVTADRLVCIKTEDGAPALLEEVTSQVDGALHPVKECEVQLNRLPSPAPLPSRPVRQNRGSKMNVMLVEEKRGVADDGSVPPEAPENEEPNGTSERSALATVDACSDNDSWRHDSDGGEQKAASGESDLSSNHSDEDDASPARGSRKGKLSKASLSVPGPLKGKGAPADGAAGTSNAKADAAKKPQPVRGLCCICKEHVKNVTAHMKTHFPDDDYACPRCDSRFKFLNSLRLHLKRSCFEYNQMQVDPARPEEARDLHKCDQCEKAFRYKVSLESHKRTHNELYCGVCRKVLRDVVALARHKACHTAFQCTRCEASFGVFKPLRKHYENVHKVSRPFKCNRCPKSFAKLRIFIGHEWKHTGNRPFQCAQCGVRFRSDNELVCHQRVHTKEKPYLCPECGKTFSQNSNLLRHLNFIHSVSRDEKKFSCSECEKSFKEKGSLKKHQRTRHYNQLFRHPCQYCGKMLSASSIVRHRLIHTGERPFPCMIAKCGKRFRTNTEVKKHVRWHHNAERPFKCDVCGKAFIYMCVLKVHMKAHSGEMPYVCHVCGKAFLWLHSMQRHKTLVHSFVKK